MFVFFFMHDFSYYCLHSYSYPHSFSYPSSCLCTSSCLIPILTTLLTLSDFYVLNHQNLQALLSAKIRCEQGPVSNHMGGYSKNGGDRGAGSNVMNMDNDYGY